MSRKYGSRLAYAKFILLGHILNPFWKGRVERRARRNYQNYLRVASYLEKYRGFVEALGGDEHEPDKAGEGKEKDLIFSIWWQGEDNAPELVKVCLQRLRETYGNRFILLDNENIRDWVDLPDFIWEKWGEGKINAANFADICRIALLLQNGGIWFDATNYLTCPVPDWVENTDVFMFRDGPRFTPEKFIQICFLKSRKDNPLMKAWFDFIMEYWKNEDFIIDYFLHQFMMRYMVDVNPRVRKMFYEMPQVEQTPTHLLWHLHSNDDYSEELYQECTKDTFFQKTSYKNENARNPRPGSVAYHLIKNHNLIYDR